MVIPRFVEQALLNEPITVYGDGSQVRSFTYISDAVAAIQALMQEPAAEGEVFNIGSPEPVSIYDLAKKIKAFSGSSSEIVCVPYALAYNSDFEDMFYRVPDISKIKNTVQFTPKLNLEAMLKAIINDYRSN
jgi:UDP-glucose 4-epimerase